MNEWMNEYRKQAVVFYDIKKASRTAVSRKAKEEMVVWIFHKASNMSLVNLISGWFLLRTISLSRANLLSDPWMSFSLSQHRKLFLPGDYLKIN